MPGLAHADDANAAELCHRKRRGPEVLKVMTPDEVQLLRKLAATESGAVRSVMSGETSEMLDSLDPRTAALVRIGALIGVGSDSSALRWAKHGTSA